MKIHFNKTRVHSNYFLRLTAPLILLLLSACSQYQLTFNETVVRTPQPLLTDVNTADKNLRNCLDQAIEDQAVTAPGQLTVLNCSHAGIKTLQGLESFRNLTHINLSHNNLTSISALAKLGRIEVLLLNDNQIKSAPELLTLPALEQLSVENNPELDCRDLYQLEDILQGTIKTAQQCTK
jgi:Leucine-rich repeat (LRR) protein